VATHSRGDSRTAGELESRLEVLRGELQEINNEWRDRRFPDEVKDCWNELVTERDEVAAQLEEVNKRTAYLEQLAERGGSEFSESPDDRWQQRRNMALVDRGPELSKAMSTPEREVALEAIDAASARGGKRGEIDKASPAWPRATPSARPSPTRPP
jgi:hypothetical protein